MKNREIDIYIKEIFDKPFPIQTRANGQKIAKIKKLKI